MNALLSLIMPARFHTNLHEELLACLIGLAVKNIAFHNMSNYFDSVHIFLTVHLQYIAGIQPGLICQPFIHNVEKWSNAF